MSYQPKPYTTERFKQLMQRTDVVAWLIDYVIPLCASVVFAGDSGVGKTWLMLYLILMVATGGKWLGHFKCKKGKVLVVDEENNIALIKERLGKLCRACGISVLDDLDIEFLVAKYIDITPIRNAKTGTYESSPKFLDLVATAKSIGATFVSIDSFSRIHCLSDSEQRDMSLINSQLKRFMDETQATILFSHHVIKHGKSGDKGSIRGSGDIAAFVDTAFVVDKCKDGVRVTQVKNRQAKEIDPFTVTLKDAGDKFYISYQGITASQAQGSCRDWLLSVLSKGPKTRKEIVAFPSGYVTRKVDQTLKELRDSGEIETERRGKEVAYKIRSQAGSYFDPTTIFSQQGATVP